MSDSLSGRKKKRQTHLCRTCSGRLHDDHAAVLAFCDSTEGRSEYDPVMVIDGGVCTVVPCGCGHGKRHEQEPCALCQDVGYLCRGCLDASGFVERVATVCGVDLALTLARKAAGKCGVCVPCYLCNRSQQRIPLAQAYRKSGRVVSAAMNWPDVMRRR